MSDINSNWLCKLSRHQSNRQDLKDLADLPQTEALRAWLASQMALKLLPIPVDNPQWVALRQRNDAQLEILRDLYLLLEPPSV